MSKHTPGPWRVEMFCGRTIGVLDSQGNSLFSSVWDTDPKSPVLLHNASLAAAAPEMLEALEAMQKELDRLKDDAVYSYNAISVYNKKQIEQVIRKAKGGDCAR